MRRDFGFSVTLEIVDAFRTAVRGFAAGEDKMDRELQSRVIALQRQRDKSQREAEAELARHTEEATQVLTARCAHLQSRYEKRSKRIEDALKSSLKTAVKRAEDAEGRLKFRLQMEGMQARRTWDQGKQAAETAFTEFSKAMVQQGQAIADLQEKAANAFQGYRAFRRLLNEPTALGDVSAGRDEYVMANELADLLTSTQSRVRSFRRRILPAFFKYGPAWFVLAFAPLLAVPVLPQMGLPAYSFKEVGIGCGAAVILGIILHRIGLAQSRGEATAIAQSIQRLCALHDACQQTSTVRHESDLARLQADFDGVTARVEQDWNQALSAGEGLRDSFRFAAQNKHARAVGNNEYAYQTLRERAEAAHRDEVGRWTEVINAQRAEVSRRCDDTESRVRQEREVLLESYAAEWSQVVPRLFERARALETAAQTLVPPWDHAAWQRWTPPAAFSGEVSLGSLRLDLEQLSGGLPKDARFALPGSKRLHVPLLLSYPSEGSVLIESDAAGADRAIGALNNMVLRLLASAPPGRLVFTVIDPVGLGQNFSGIMHLADHAEHLIHHKIWTQAEQIERQLGELTEHMEKVIQMYLRNEYPTIAEYNEQAGTIAEKYHVLVVADFPSGFSETAAKRLLSIATSGAKCGVHTLIHWDSRHAAPPDFAADELRRSSVCVTCRGSEVGLTDRVLPGVEVVLDAPPPSELAIQLIQAVGKANRDSNRVEVPFSQIAPSEEAFWSEVTGSELRVPIGRTGATKLQYLAIGKGTRQHALVAGKTGSGKSTLFHVIITNLALWCSPEEVEFYLVDFKKGVEFKCYAAERLPHAKVVGIESDREFGLSVLQKLDDELRRRGDLFRKAGAQEIGAFRRLSAGAEPMPRVLLLIDEFQELFVEDDKVSQSASVLLDRIVRQGRAFGMHVILGSQTLGGAYTVARATLGQMVIRIALQCNEADAYLIMDDSNPAPRLLSRPGEGIYNDAAGAVESNSPFQVVWLTDETRDRYLKQVRARADAAGRAHPGPFVYEGDAAASVSENALLQALVTGYQRTAAPGVPRTWLGAPNSIKGPTELVFPRQSAKNLLIVGQREEATLAMLCIALVSLASQHDPEGARFVFLDGTSADTTERRFVERVVGCIPQRVALSARDDLNAIFQDLAAELRARTEASESAPTPAIFVLINGLQRYKKLRNEDEFSFSSDASGGESPATILAKLISEGPAVGIHILAGFDGFNNVGRFLSRKAISEFEMRVLFQMSANDSASLIDSPKASMLGMHRAVYYNDQIGSMEVFRPYAMPETPWLEQVAQGLGSAR